MHVRHLLSAVIGSLAIASCDAHEPLVWNAGDGYSWAEVSPGIWGGAGFREVSDTGIGFRNHLTPAEIAENRVYLNGSGVAAGDVNGDGLIDLYFASLNGPNRLYRNVGGWEFEDVTERAGVAHEGHYSTGVVLEDVDGDGHLDLLVASVHRGVTVYRNDGTGVFDRVSQPGLAPTEGKGTTTLALSDIDGDGDLDLYVTNYRERSINDLVEMRELTWDHTVATSGDPDDPSYELIEPFDRFFTIVERDGLLPERREVGEPDQLFLNDGRGNFTPTEPRDHFRDADGTPVELGRDWGLAAKFHDLNGDGLPDLYVCNDFWTPDRVWINQGGGVFREADHRSFRNFSFSAMAVDFSDVNRDGVVDVFVTEMLSALHERRLRHYVPSGPYPDLAYRTAGQPQYNRNSLYVGRGDGTYAETAYFSGVAASEWSWGTEFVDVDLDGYEDILVGTGFSFDLQDLDTQLRMDQEIARGMRASRGHLVDYPRLELVNRAFRNRGDLTFAEVSGEWGFRDADISHSLAVADLDGDGDADVVFNRLDAPAAVYRNATTAPRIGVRLEGRAPNTRAVGALVALEGGPVRQTKEITSGGSYLSSPDPMVTFAAGDGEGPRSIVVVWPEGDRTRIERVEPGRIYRIRAPEELGAARARGADQSGRASPSEPASQAGGPTIFEDVSERLDHAHQEAEFDDFELQPLLPTMLSRQGPGVAWADLDGDGDDDLLVAPGRGAPLAAFENLGDGSFGEMDLGAPSEPAPGDQTTVLAWSEEAGVSLVAGSQNLEQGNVGAAAAFHYIVTQEGPTSSGSLPDNLSTTGPLAAADYDGDGRVDLFVGGGFLPARYPASATSRVFLNRGGRFSLDRANADAFRDLGLATGAVFTDYDGDGDPDLVVSTEWGPLRLFRNDEGRFVEVTEEVGLAEHTGWWKGVATGDFDNDGLPDIVATNNGRNGPHRPDADHPFRIYYADFNFDGRVDPIESYYDPVAEAYVPRRQLHALESVQVAILDGIRSHRDFAAASVSDLLGHRESDVLYREASTLDHTVFLNRDGRFTPRSLPPHAQLSAGFAAVVADFDNDGNEDVFLSQNLFSVRPELPRQDAGRGLLLHGDGEGGFVAVPGHESGVMAYGEQRGAAASDFDADGRTDLVVAQNDGPTRLYRNQSPRRGLRVRLSGPVQNRWGIGSSMRIAYSDGTKGPLREVQAGSGYWSQNGAVQVLGTAPDREVEAIEVRWFDGSSARVEAAASDSELVVEK